MSLFNWYNSPADEISQEDLNAMNDAKEKLKTLIDAHIDVLNGMGEGSDEEKEFKTMSISKVKIIQKQIDELTNFDDADEDGTQKILLQCFTKFAKIYTEYLRFQTSILENVSRPIVGETFSQLQMYIEGDGEKIIKSKGVVGLTATIGNRAVTEEMMYLFRRPQEVKTRNEVSNLVKAYFASYIR